jgi:hypothetical protein
MTTTTAQPAEVQRPQTWPVVAAQALLPPPVSAVPVIVSLEAEEEGEEVVAVAMMLVLV